LIAEYKFKDSFEFIPYARLIFSANQALLESSARRRAEGL